MTQSDAFSALIKGKLIIINDHRYRLFCPGQLIPTVAGHVEAHTFWVGMEVTVVKEGIPLLTYVGVPLEVVELCIAVQAGALQIE